MSIEVSAAFAGRMELRARRMAALIGIALAALAARPAAAEEARPPAESASQRPVTLGEVATSPAAGSTRLLNVLSSCASTPRRSSPRSTGRTPSYGIATRCQR